MVFTTMRSSFNLSAAGPFGIALPSTAVDYITAIDLKQTQKITFIENKTNYDEYILSERCKEELVVYHGGFLSPQKKSSLPKLGRLCVRIVRFSFGRILTSEVSGCIHSFNS